MVIKNAKYLISNADVRKCPAGNLPEFAFIGRSNVGKSSLINMLTGRKALAKTSQKPGKTLLINHFSINDGKFYIVDLPGYGYAQRGKAQREQFSKIIEDYVLERQQMTILFVLIDIRHAPQKIDMEFMDWLGENEIPFAIIFTKSDKLGPVAGQRNVDAYLKELHLHWEELPPYFITSAESRKGREEVLSFMEQIMKDVEDSQVIEEEKENNDNQTTENNNNQN